MYIIKNLFIAIEPMLILQFIMTTITSIWKVDSIERLALVLSSSYMRQLLQTTLVFWNIHVILNPPAFNTLRCEAYISACQIMLPL